MTLPDGYSLETVANSSVGPDTELEVGGLNVRSNDNLLACTRGGELWEMDSESGAWTRLTDSLHQTLGIWTEDDSEDIWVMQKPELTRLVDDSPAPGIDMYETVCEEFGISGDRHEFAFGPVRDSEGNFYVNLNLGDEGSGPLTGVMIYSAPYRGHCFKITPDGECTPFAWGYRSPAGIGINDDDELFYSDNQGDWVPVCHIAHVTEDSFHGHPHSLGPHDGFPSYDDLGSVTAEEILEARKPPVVWIPYDLAPSTGGVTFEETGNFGPFGGQAFYSCQNNANLSRVYMEEVNGSYQGATFPFTDIGEFQCGTLREEFTNDGSSLYLGQTDRGWGSVSGEPYGIQRIDYDGETTPFEMHSVEIMASGFRVNFTKPADETAARNANNWDVSHWTYNFHASYGSSQVNETSVSPADITPTVVDGGSAVELELPSVGPADVDGVTTVRGRIYAIEPDGIAAADGSEMAHPAGYYTVNDVPN
jgi:hypothetical protein